MHFQHTDLSENASVTRFLTIDIKKQLVFELFNISKVSKVSKVADARSAGGLVGPMSMEAPSTRFSSFNKNTIRKLHYMVMPELDSNSLCVFSKQLIEIESLRGAEWRFFREVGPLETGCVARPSIVVAPSGDTSSPFPLALQAPSGDSSEKWVLWRRGASQDLQSEWLPVVIPAKAGCFVFFVYCTPPSLLLLRKQKGICG